MADEPKAVSMRCICDACKFELTTEESAARDPAERICAFCREGCYRSATLNGVKSWLKLAGDARQQRHDQLETDAAESAARKDAFRRQGNQVVGELIDSAKPYAKKAAEMLFDAGLAKLKKKLGGS